MPLKILDPGQNGLDGNRCHYYSERHSVKNPEKKKKMCRVNSLKMLTKQIPVTKQRLYTPHKSVKGDKFHITKSHFP